MRFRLEGGITMPMALIAVGGAAALALATVCVGGVLAETETQKLLASDGVAEDRFGSAVARDGDTLIVGAPQAFINGLPGSFYVFAPDEGGRWIEEGRVLSPLGPGGPYGDEFGAAIALDGDSLFVGAPLREDGPFLGRSYAYSRHGDAEWTLDQDFPPPSPKFGQSIALDGDTAVIASDSEAVVLTRDGSDPWSQEALLSADTTGTIVAFDGETIAVGGRFSNLEIGAVTFVKQGGTWSPSAVISMLTTPFPENPYMLVRDLSIDGDRLALGITNALGPDQVFVYERDASSGDWIEEAVLDPDVVEGDGFGARLFLEGDLLLVGATSAGLGGTVYGYRRSGRGEWTEATQLVPSDGFFGKGFGRAIHLAGGIAVVGSGDHDNGLHAGAAYVFGASLGPSLAVAGSCPGPMSFEVTGATPGGRVALVYASGEGEVVVPPGRVCAGTELGLDGTARVARIVVADGNGAAQVEANVPAAACGRTFVQVVDAETCAPSGVEGL